MLLNLAPSYALAETKYDRIKEAKNWVRHTQISPWFKTQMPVTLQNLALAAGMTDYDILNQFMDGRWETEERANKILRLKEKIIRREAVFVEGHGIYYLGPQPIKLAPPLIKRTHEEEDWTLQSTCRACGNNQYLPADMNTDDYALCYHCIPPHQYPAYGATPQEGSMILYALDEMGILGDIMLLHEKPKKVKPIQAEVPLKKKPGPKPKRKKPGPKRKKKRLSWSRP